ncbi:hypothetical protein KIN20_011000 [Parelaphostrongylus tenuis]|uniref:Uncharacterized protein n=1 Tax=Parelaphostrongylus tenuis TaxID=148309 RepID=A0AAD5QJ77_PARTN|nr:hypothetical protein KIN20_011000 [Parelaphostrongylus tenuis]
MSSRRKPSHNTQKENPSSSGRSKRLKSSGKDDLILDVVEVRAIVLKVVEQLQEGKVDLRDRNHGKVEHLSGVLAVVREGESNRILD